MASSIDHALKTTVIERSRGFNLQFRELWEYRELVFFLGWKDVLARYSQAYIGLAWAIVQPVISVIMLSVVMGKLAKLPSDGVPFPIFVFAGTLCWQYFATVTATAQTAVGLTGRLMSKVYFPRLVMPLSLMIPPAVDFLAGTIVFACAMIIWRYPLSKNIVWLPVFLVFELLIALAFSLWYMAINIAFRDLRHIFPLITQFLYMSSGVFYSSKMIPAKFSLLYDLNPIASLLQGVRWSLFGTGAEPGWHLALCFMIVLALILTGILVYNRVARNIADIV